MDVTVWLERVGLGHYAELFAENRVDFDVLSDLTDSDLKDLGIPLGDRKRLRKAIDALADQDDTGYRYGVSPPAQGVQLANNLPVAGPLGQRA